MPENSWNIIQRYSDFANLDSVLRISNIELPLPPKRIWGNMDRDFIAERQTGLQVKYLIIIAIYVDLYNKAPFEALKGVPIYTRLLT